MITKDQYEEALRIVQEYEAQNQPKPPKIVQAPEGCKEYLTPGKNYVVTGTWDSVGDWHGFEIVDDHGYPLKCLEKKCGFLNGGDWIIVEREE